MSWFVLPSKRSPAVDDRPPLTRPDGWSGHGNATSVFVQLRRLLALWRDDPDRLVVAAAAWTLSGQNVQGLIWDVASGDTELGIKSITDDEARELLERALRGRHSRVLRLRGEGLLLGLEAVSQDAEWAQLHRVQADVCVIQCRRLSLDEQAAALRQRCTCGDGSAEDDRGAVLRCAVHGIGEPVEQS